MYIAHFKNKIVITIFLLRQVQRRGQFLLYFKILYRNFFQHNVENMKLTIVKLGIRFIWYCMCSFCDILLYRFFGSVLLLSFIKCINVDCSVTEGMAYSKPLYMMTFDLKSTNLGLKYGTTVNVIVWYKKLIKWKFNKQTKK